MSYPLQAMTQQVPVDIKPLHAIVANSHPGGRYPGLQLPPTWYTRETPQTVIDCVLPDASDSPAIYDAVVNMSRQISTAAVDAFDQGAHPMLIGGDHSLILGNLAAAVARYERVGVIWVDAHADFNTPDTSPSGNPHGMPLSAAVGLGDSRLTSLFTHTVRPSDIVLIGARDIDPGEAKLLAEHGVWHVTVDELRRLGVPGLLKAIEERLDGLPVHLSFDFDALSAECFSATGTPVPEGLQPDEAEALLKGLAKGPLDIVSSDWVEFDPRHPEAPECAALAQRMFDAFHQS